MQLVIAEKPDLGKAIAAAILPGGTLKKGYIESKNMIVTWAFGHLFKLKQPEEYDPNLKKWNLSALPIYFDDWQISPDPEKLDQIKLIEGFIKKADLIIHAGDPDDEGQLLIDEILDYFGYKGKVLRLSTNDLTPAVIQKAYKNMVDNRTMRPLGEAARARSVADFTLGINYSRFFTLKNNVLLSVGRVQSPTLGLVAARDAVIDGHVKAIYYDGYIHTHIVPDCLSSLCVTLPKGHYLLNENGHIQDKKMLEKLLDGLKGTKATISVTKRQFDEAPPLPFNLTKLQTAAFQRFKLNPEDTLKITQSLREKYHLITYNRSTCQYLNDEQFAEAPKVVNAVVGNLHAIIPRLDTKRKSAAFDSEKVGESAHTGIIPTSQKADLSRLTVQEKNIYRLIAAQYLAQFMPPCRKETTKAAADLQDGLKASSSATQILDKGYREILPSKDKPDDSPELCSIPAGTYSNKTIEDVSIKEKETKPPARYTLASLGEDMTRISKYVSDPRIKQLLLAKDDGKEGENGSIGTPATRDAIVKTLIKRGYIEVKGGKVFSTSLGRDFYNMLPDEVKTADLTAEWWAICEDIKEGKAAPQQLYDSILASVDTLLHSGYQGKALSAKSGGTVIGTCPLCGSPVKMGKFGAYCSAYKDSTKPCPFKVSDTFFSKKLTQTQITNLMAGKKVAVKGLTSPRTGKKFDANLKFNGEATEKGYAKFEMIFDSKHSKK